MHALQYFANLLLQCPHVQRVKTTRRVVQRKKALALLQSLSCSLAPAPQDAPAWKALFDTRETASMSQNVQVRW